MCSSLLGSFYPIVDFLLNGKLSLRHSKSGTAFSVKGDGFSGGKIAARKWEREVNMRRGESLLTSLRAGVRLHPSRRLGLASALVSRALAQVLSACISWRR
jgi:hypothetical protein